MGQHYKILMTGGVYFFGELGSSSSSSSSSFSSCSSSSSSFSSSSSSSSSTSGIPQRYVTATRTWKAITVRWDNNAAEQLIFIINDYEKLFRNPVANGVYTYIATDVLTQNWVDREDLIFTWEKRWFNDGSIVEAPQLGSHKELWGALLRVARVLRANA